MKQNAKHIFIRLSFAFIWLLFIEGGKRSDHYVFFGEFDGVKHYINQNIDLTKQTQEQKRAIKHIQITEYQKFEPYYKKKPKTKPLFIIDSKIN